MARAAQVGLKMNARKTKVMRLNTQNIRKIQTQGEDLEVDSFVYLGRTITTNGGCDEDITNRLKKARGHFQRMKKIWYSSIFSTTTKIWLYNTLVKCGR
jgi:hypothetical protein